MIYTSQAFFTELLPDRLAPRVRQLMLFSAAAIFIGGAAFKSDAAFAADSSDVEGLWGTGGSLIEVTQTGDTLEMVVVALEKPFDADGEPLVDAQNPDETLRSQPILGMNLLADYSFDGKRWAGKIYDPESGSTYSSRMKRDENVLEMRGYIGTPLLGKTKKFQHISQCRPDMLVMLSNAKISGYCGFDAPFANEPLAGEPSASEPLDSAPSASDP